MRTTQVLIVGAGPTGLVLALWLKRAGIAVRIIDQAAEPGASSRALVVHARTLEFYRQLGLSDDVLARGLAFTAINLWVRGRRVSRAELGAIGRGLTPYPEMVIFPQDEHERLLLTYLEREGLEVERNTELVGFEQHGDRVTVRTKDRRGSERETEADYLAGCDGAHSRVRETLGIGFEGGTYERVFYVADVELKGPANDRELHVAIDDADFLAVFPLKGEHTGRLIGAVVPEAEGRHDLSWNDVSPKAIARMRLEVERVNWFSTYRVHHRVADRFQVGRVFLVGDAAHVHSPVGGQGMNTGIGDAVNLAWKLADTLHGRARPEAGLLASYQQERIGFARRLVATTDRAFTLVSRNGWLARNVRLRVLPWLLPRVMRRQAARRFAFRVLSQTAITYRRTALCRGRAGKIRGGDRLPWLEDLDNGQPLASRDWQLHVYGDVSPQQWRVAERRRTALYVFPWTRTGHRAGLKRGAAYLIRPDGYVAVAEPGPRAHRIDGFLARLMSDRMSPEANPPIPRPAAAQPAYTTRFSPREPVESSRR